MNVLTISPYMEDFVQAAILDAPVTNQLGVGGTQVNLLIGQFKESGILFWANAVGPKLIKGGVLLLRPRGDVHTRLQTGSDIIKPLRFRPTYLRRYSESRENHDDESGFQSRRLLHHAFLCGEPFNGVPRALV